MPCNSDYLNPNDQEIEYSKVLALLVEVETGKLPPSYGDGFFVECYNRTTKKLLDEAVEMLCNKCQEIKDIENYSLEMQMWWRDHQKADKERLGQEIIEAQERNEKNIALSKLTDYEKNLLGLIN